MATATWLLVDWTHFTVPLGTVDQVDITRRDGGTVLLICCREGALEWPGMAEFMFVCLNEGASRVG